MGGVVAKHPSHCAVSWHFDSPVTSASSYYTTITCSGRLNLGTSIKTCDSNPAPQTAALPRSLAGSKRPVVP
jgi:hypothetical protein